MSSQTPTLNEAKQWLRSQGFDVYPGRQNRTGALFVVKRPSGYQQTLTEGKVIEKALRFGWQPPHAPLDRETIRECVQSGWDAAMELCSCLVESSLTLDQARERILSCKQAGHRTVRA